MLTITDQSMDRVVIKILCKNIKLKIINNKHKIKHNQVLYSDHSHIIKQTFEGYMH